MIFLLIKSTTELHEDVCDSIVFASTKIEDVLKHLTPGVYDNMGIVIFKEDTCDKETIDVNERMDEYFMYWPPKFLGYNEIDRIHYHLHKWCNKLRDIIEERNQLKLAEKERRERAEYERLKAKFENS